MKRFSMLSRLLFAALLAVALPATVRAEPYSQKQLEAWADNLLTEMRKAGAEEASHGSVSYDPSSSKFSISDIRLGLRKKAWSFEPRQEGKETKSSVKVESLKFPIARITADNLMMS